MASFENLEILAVDNRGYTDGERLPFPCVPTASQKEIDEALRRAKLKIKNPRTVFVQLVRTYGGDAALREPEELFRWSRPMENADAG